MLDTPTEKIRGFNTYESLSSVINKIKEDKAYFDFVIVSGDISQATTEKSYQLFYDTLAQLKKPIYCIPGNHDNPALLNRFFPHTPTDSVTSIKHNNLLLILVNTQVKGQQYGRISENNLTKISTLLRNNSDLNAIITLHHPPISINSQWMDNIGLKNSNIFLQLVQRHQNLKLILSGHVHQEINTTHQHIKVFTTPSTCYQFKPNVNSMQYDESLPAYRLVKISNNGTIDSHVYRL